MNAINDWFALPIRSEMRASPQAVAAVKAAKNEKRWGGYAARRYAERHDALRMYLLALGYEWKREAMLAARKEGGAQ